ncbi:MAG: hypothetical protein VKL60_20895 [Sphaerospermopsis sp.]|nr:hypothetical protein [Sphaerospermopsis sp.]
MAEICSCETVMGNTGLPSCYKALKVATGIFMTPTYANDGTKNVIDVTDTIDDAYITAAINNADQSKRWYPLQKPNNVTSERAEPVFDTRSDGGRAKVKDGIRTFNFELWEGGARLKKMIDKGGCRDFSFFIINEGRIIGLDLTDEQLELAPIRIAKDSLVANYLMATDTTVEKIAISLQFDQRENDGNLSYVEVADDADLTGYRGLLDIYSEIVQNTLTTITVKLFNKYGAANNKNVLTGLVAADFALYNVTDSAAVTVSSCVENPEGSYLLTFTAQTANDVLRITPTKAGYDFTAVIALTSILTA